MLCLSFSVIIDITIFFACKTIPPPPPPLCNNTNDVNSYYMTDLVFTLL